MDGQKDRPFAIAIPRIALWKHLNVFFLNLQNASLSEGFALRTPPALDPRRKYALPITETQLHVPRPTPKHYTNNNSLRRYTIIGLLEQFSSVEIVLQTLFFLSLSRYNTSLILYNIGCFTTAAISCSASIASMINKVGRTTTSEMTLSKH